MLGCLYFCSLLCSEVALCRWSGVKTCEFTVFCRWFKHVFLFLCSFVSLSLGLSACNSSGHLSNHAEIAPSYAGITFAISNTLVSPLSVCLSVSVCLQHFWYCFESAFCHSLSSLPVFLWYPSVCVCLSFSLRACLSFSLFLYLCMSVSLCLCFSEFIRLSACVPVSLYTLICLMSAFVSSSEKSTDLYPWPPPFLLLLLDEKKRTQRQQQP